MGSDEGNPSLFHAAGVISSDELVQVIAVWPTIAKRFRVEQSLDATVGTDSIRILGVIPHRPTHLSVPAPAEECHCGGA